MVFTRLSEEFRPLGRAPGVRLHGTAAMIAACLVLMLVFNGANLPSSLYVIYRERFHFAEVTLTLVFASYVVGAATGLVFFGRLSDQVGRRAVLFAALALSALSAALFLIVLNTPMLFGACLSMASPSD